MPFDPNDPNSPTPDPTPPLPPAADTYQLPDQSPQNQFSMQQANAAMTPQVGPPVTAQPGALKGLLTNFFGGMGRAMMTHAGLETPEQQQQKQQQEAMQRQVAQSTVQYHQAAAENLRSQNEMMPYQLPDSPDGTPGETIMLPKKSLGPLAVQQMKNASKPGLAMATIGPEHAQLLPGLPVGTQVPKMLLDKALLNTASKQALANNASGKTPNEIALIQRAQNGDQEAQKTLDTLEKRKIDLAKAQGAMRGEAYGAFRPVQTIDQEGNLGYDFAGHAIASGAIPAGAGAQVMSKQAQFGEMKSASGNLRSAIQGLDRDFTPAQRAKLQLAMQTPDAGIATNIMSSLLGTEQLTSSQQQYVIWLTQMNERLMSLRNVAGMGQGSDDLRNAIRATLPNVKSADKGYALKQMDAVDNQINQLEQGIPKIRRSTGTTTSQATEGKKQAYRVGNKWFDASTHQEIK